MYPIEIQRILKEQKKQRHLDKLLAKEGNKECHLIYRHAIFFKPVEQTNTRKMELKK